ncbi:hypothetical protein V1264_004754 [Littorina saxatilis]|uniref:Galectin n=1 Tax=Littorina saxatilis TaxID=31220 RepID=A0AAN9G6Y9_9CAEN
MWGPLAWTAMMIFVSEAVITSHKFDLATSQNVTQYQEMTSASSKLMCVKECLKHSWCDSFAYGSARGECFLQVESETLLWIDDDVKVYRVRSLCNPSDVDHTMFNVTWRQPGLEGDIRCNDDDYMYSGDSPTIHCKQPGLWITDGTCRQRIWRNTQASDRHPFPRTISPGWAMCVRGVSCTACDKFSFNLRNDSQYVVHVDVRFDFSNSKRILYLTSNVNGWLDGTFVGNFPFDLGEPFEVELRVSDWNTLEV